MAKILIPKFTVLIDSREKIPYEFPSDEHCNGSVIQALKSGDYSIKNGEHLLSIERKRSITEVAQNLLQDRFYRELDRLEEYRFSFIVCEFGFSHVINYPYAGVPKSLISKIKITGKFLLRKINEIQTKYKTPFLFCDNISYAQEMCYGIMKRTNEVIWHETIGI